jgi:hypothetical protein
MGTMVMTIKEGLAMVDVEKAIAEGTRSQISSTTLPPFAVLSRMMIPTCLEPCTNTTLTVMTSQTRCNTTSHLKSFSSM